MLTIWSVLQLAPLTMYACYLAHRYLSSMQARVLQVALIIGFGALCIAQYLDLLHVAMLIIMHVGTSLAVLAMATSMAMNSLRVASGRQRGYREIIKAVFILATPFLFRL